MGIVGVSMAAAALSFGVVFMFCELGEELNGQTKEINDAMCELDWDSFPLNLQRMMPMILLTTQHPKELTAYGGTLCTRNTFKRVSHQNL